MSSEKNQLFAAFALLLVACALIVAASLHPKLQTSSNLRSTARSNPLQSYAEGKANQATHDLEASARGAGPVAKRIGNLTDLADFCFRLADQECLVREAPLFVQTFQELLKGNADLSVKTLAAHDITLAMMQEAFLSQRWATLEDAIKGQGSFSGAPFNLAPLPEFSPPIYVQKHLIVARYLALKGDYQASQEEVAKVLSAVSVAAQGATQSRALLMLSLPEILEVSLETGDTLRAIRLMAVLGSLADQNLKSSIPDRARWEIAKAEFFVSFMAWDAARVACEEARRLIAKSDLRGDVRDWPLSRVINIETIVRAFLGDLRGAESVHKENPYRLRALNAKQTGTFSDAGSIWFAVADIYLDSVSSRRPDTRWLGPLRNFDVDKSIIESKPGRIQAAALKSFAISLAEMRDDSADAAPLMFESASDIIKLYEQKLAASPDGFPMPNWVEKIILQTTLSMFASDSVKYRDHTDLALQASDILNRTVLQHSSDLASMAAAGGDDDTLKLAGRSVIALSEQMRQLELSALRNLVEISEKASRDPAAFKDRENSRTNYARAALARRSLVASLSTTKFGAARGAMPNATQLTNSLGPDEAFVTTILLPIGVVQVCATHEKIIFRPFATRSNPAELIAAEKLINLSLTATHAKSDVLDAQYPVDSAILFYKTILGSIEECVSSKSHIIYAPHPALAAAPIQTLLPDRPARTSTGYDLKSAKWFGWSHAVSIVGSVQGFLAVRALAKTAPEQNSYLGIGDPILSDKGNQLLALRSAGGVSSAVHLPELPETASELSTSAKFFAQSTVLIRSNATEERFRQQALSEYGVIAFATHGLLAGDLPALQEAALVFTPTSGAPSVDGILTASEMAQLPLRARLVILSACNTANVDATALAPSLQGLAVALAAAGVPSTLAAAWPVESNFSAEHVKRFATLVSSGVPVAEANRRALLALRAGPDPAFAHPRFWAPFSVYGDGAVTLQPLSITNKNLTRIYVRPDPHYGELINFAALSKPTADRSTSAFNVMGFQAPSSTGRLTAEVLEFSDKGGPFHIARLPQQGAGVLADLAKGPVFLTYQYDLHRTQLFFHTGLDLELPSTIQTRSILSAPGMHIPFSGFVTDNQQILTAVYSSDDKNNQKIEVWPLQTGEFAGRHLSFPLPREANIIGGQVFYAGPDRILVAAYSLELSPDLANRGANDFAAYNYCDRASGFSTYLFTVKISTLTRLADKKIAQLKITDFDSDHSAFAGSIGGGCNEPTVGVIGELRQDLSTKITFRTPAIGDMQLDALHVTSNGIDAIGSLKRNIAIDKIGVARTSSADSGDKSVMQPENESIDIVRLHLDLPSGRTTWRLLGFGGGAYVTRARYLDNRFVVIGSVEGNQMLVQVP